MNNSSTAVTHTQNPFRYIRKFFMIRNYEQNIEEMGSYNKLLERKIGGKKGQVLTTSMPSSTAVAARLLPIFNVYSCQPLFAIC